MLKSTRNQKYGVLQSFSSANHVQNALSNKILMVLQNLTKKSGPKKIEPDRTFLHPWSKPMGQICNSHPYQNIAHTNPQPHINLTLIQQHFHWHIQQLIHQLMTNMKQCLCMRPMNVFFFLLCPQTLTMSEMSSLCE